MKRTTMKQLSTQLTVVLRGTGKAVEIRAREKQLKNYGTA